MNNQSTSKSAFPVKPTIAARRYGFYSAAFGNIASGWYESESAGAYGIERDKLKRVWMPEFDSIIQNYLLEYGAFFLAWSEDIAKEIKQKYQLDVLEICRYFDYFISSRVCSIPKLLELWEESLKEKGESKYECRICGKKFLLVDAHPDLLREHGLGINICRNCNYVYKRYLNRSPAALSLLPDVMKKIHENRSCYCCGQNFTLENYIFVYSPIFGQNVDMLFVNLYANVCLECFKKGCDDYSKGRKKDRLKALKDYADFLGHIPHRDFAYEILNLHDKSRMGDLFKILRFIRTNNGYRREYGSFFEALVKAKVLPNGSQRMSRGTRTLAADGDLCYSLKEKEIDDFLYNNKVLHVKESRYPDSEMRADWEIKIHEQRIFIEYFGLIGVPEYAKKVELKKSICEKYSIRLIALYPFSNLIEELTPIVEEYFKMHGYMFR